MLEEYLEVFGGILIEGIRGCGKTTTGIQIAKSSVRLDQAPPDLIEIAGLSPEMILQGDKSRLIDEWQLAPFLWNSIRHEIDEIREPGQFLLSGSATPSDDVTRHTGAGRLARMRMRTMSLFESRDSSGAISLNKLNNKEKVATKSDLSFMDIVSVAVRGGWPALLGSTAKQAQLFNRAYLDSLRSSAINDLAGINYDPERMRRLIQSLARNTTTEVSLRTLQNDISGGDVSINVQTVRKYFDALLRVFAIEELSAWSVSLRSNSRLRNSPKVMFSEPALAVAALGVSTERLSLDLEFFGQIFEAMVVRDLRIYAEVYGANVYHYRDNTGLEVDSIIEYPDGQWAVVEVKAGSMRIKEAEKALLVLRDERIDTKRVGEPKFLAIVTATEFAYTLE